MVERGSSTRHFLLTRPSAFEVLEPILGEALLHQREVEDLGLKLNQTRAGQTQPEELVGAHEEKSNRIWSELKDPSLPSGTSAECNDVKGYTSLPCAMFTRDRAGPQSPLVSRLSRNSVVDSEQLSQEDVTIVVMGPTGSGKSTFIETVTGIRGIVGHASESCTHKIAVFKITFPELGSDIHFVDTPGFDDTTRSDVDIFKMISDWLHNTYRKRIQVTGLLYFHRISDNRMAGTALKNLRLFESLCGEEFNKIVLTTTMWDEVDEKTGRYRENDLKNSYWEAMVERGSTIRRFLLTRPSAFEVLEPILREVSKRKALLLQREVEDLGLKLNETRARQTLSLHLEELVGAHEEKLNRIRNELKDPSITPTQLRLLMEDCQTITRQIQETMDNAKRIKTLTTSKSPKKLRHFIDTVFRPKIPRPTSRQEKAPAPPRVQDRETRLPQSTLEEEMVLPRRNPTTSGSSRHDRPRSPGEGASSSSRGPSNLYRPPQRWDTMTGSSSNQPEYTSSSSLSSGGLLRSTGLRSVPNQPFHSWQSTPPPRSHTVRPDGRRASLTSPSRRASTPPTDGTMGSHQGVPSAQDQPLMTPLRRSRSQPQDAPPPIPRLPWL